MEKSKKNANRAETRTLSVWSGQNSKKKFTPFVAIGKDKIKMASFSQPAHRMHLFSMLYRSELNIFDQ